MHHQNTCGSSPLPDVDVSPLEDFTYVYEFSPVSSPEPVHTRNEYSLTNMLPAFSILFGRDFGYEEACRRSVGPESEDVVVNFDENSKGYIKLDAVTSGPSCAAPVWIPPSMLREASSEAASLSCEASAKSVPVCEASLKSPPVLKAASKSPNRGATRTAMSRTAKREAPSEVREEKPWKRRRDASPVDSSSPSPESTSALRRRPARCSTPLPKESEQSPKTRRFRNNLRERQRMKIVGDAMSTLQDVIPLPEEKKKTKLQTLRAATHYIEFLHEVYAASAYELIHGQVPKDTKCGVRYALAGFKRKSIRAVLTGNSEVLSCAFNLWIRENNYDEEGFHRRRNSCDDTTESSLSSQTTTYPMSPSLPSPTVSSVPSPTVSPCLPSLTASVFAYQPDFQQTPGPWNWDY